MVGSINFIVLLVAARGLRLIGIIGSGGWLVKELILEVVYSAG